MKKISPIFLLLLTALTLGACGTRDYDENLSPKSPDSSVLVPPQTRLRQHAPGPAQVTAPGSRMGGEAPVPGLPEIFDENLDSENEWQFMEVKSRAGTMSLGLTFYSTMLGASSGALAILLAPRLASLWNRALEKRAANKQRTTKMTTTRRTTKPTKPSFGQRAKEVAIGAGIGGVCAALMANIAGAKAVAPGSRRPAIIQPVDFSGRADRAERSDSAQEDLRR